MSIHSEIDETLRRLGSVEPPSGLETRVNRRLQIPRKRFSISVIQAISACAVAAGVALSAIALNPALRNLVLHQHPTAQSVPVAGPPRVVAPAAGGFGTASAVHVPVEPVPVQPTPVHQGHRRPCRAVSPRPTLRPPIRASLQHPTRVASRLQKSAPSGKAKTCTSRAGCELFGLAVPFVFTAPLR
jgi:hypothetical protein